MSILKDDKQYIWHPFTQMQSSNPIPITRGSGSCVYDQDGKEYIDAISSWWVNIHGHSHPYIAEKVSKQLQTLNHVLFAGFTHQPATELCRKLSKYLPKNQAKFFFSGDGSSAVEIALKMSIQYWRNKGQKRQRILALDGGYHGETFGAMSVGGRSIFSAHFTDYLFEVVHLPFPSNEKQTVDTLKKALEKDDVACFIFEPLVQGAAGMRMYSANILDEMIALCQQKEVLCIADEVMTGFGRTGTFFACDQLNNQPDFMCLSKSLSGGTVPISLTTCTQNIYDSFLGNDISSAFLHGHSFTGNPIGCSAAIASLELLENQSCQSNIKEIVKAHGRFAKELISHSQIREVRQCGTILAIEIDTSNKGYTSNVREILYHHFLSQGIILRPLGNVIYVLPPYCISEDQLKKVYRGILSGLNELQ
ncbi:MAG: adenosylmethionine--8-amino-7-oxononanoate transaminase [Flavobacteriales bacterium]